VLSNIFSI